MPKLTKRYVDSLKADPAKERFEWDVGDGSLKGFGVRIKPTGSAAYIVQYRNAQGRTRRMTLGKVGVLTPEQARAEAIERLRQVAKGNDPSTERRAARSDLTVGELCDMHLEEAKGIIKDSTWKMDKSRIECHVKPLLGRIPVSILTVQDIERFQSAVAAGKTSKKRVVKGRSGLQRGGRGVAARTVGMLGTILEMARRRKFISENPARDVRKYPDNKRQRFLSSEEIKSLGKAMQEAQNGAMNKVGIDAVKMLLLTGCRKNEILSLPWAAVDKKSGCLRFADTKSGAQIRPMGAAASDQLDLIKRHSGWVFPASRGEGHFIGLPKIFEKLCEKAGIKGASLHVLRHTFAASAAELGFSELTIAGLLGHSVPGITARYAHMPDRALVSAANLVSAHIASLLDGTKDDAGSRVIEIHQQFSG